LHILSTSLQQPAEGLGGCLVVGIYQVGVSVEGKVEIGVAEAGLYGLEVDVGADE
jgi:hypothetical protein